MEQVNLGGGGIGCASCHVSFIPVGSSPETGYHLEWTQVKGNFARQRPHPEAQARLKAALGEAQALTPEPKGRGQCPAASRGSQNSGTTTGSPSAMADWWAQTPAAVMLAPRV